MWLPIPFIGGEGKCPFPAGIRGVYALIISAQALVMAYFGVVAYLKQPGGGKR
jgi:hypothetical protein